MRVFRVCLVLFAALVPLTLNAAGGQERTASPPAARPADAFAGKTMDQLFAQLADKSDPDAGQAAENEIQRRWLNSGGDTIDLLMQWSAQSLATKDYGASLDFLDAVTALKPDYAEAWNRRATIYYLQDDYGKAIADLEKVLALEPRHFGALAGLGLILRDIDRKADALAALQKALAIDPYLDSDVQDTIDELKPEVDGEEI